MKKLCIMLSAILCLSLLGGCSVDITVRDENGSSIPIPDGVESMVGDIIEGALTTTTTTGTSKAEESTTSQETTTAAKQDTVTTTASSKATTTTTKASTTTTTTKAPAATPKPNTAKYITGIAINTKPAKLSYKTGDKLDTTGLVLSRLYNDGSSDTITSGFTAMGFNSRTPGTKTVTIVYKHENGSTLTCTYNVTVEKKGHGTPNVNATYHDDMAREVLALINKARKDAGLNELKMDNGKMMAAAKVRAKEITIDWAHERPDHDKWETVFDEEGVNYNARGENLAKGQKTAGAVFTDWMNSKDHRDNIMQPAFTHISIVCMEYKGNFYWVQLFGANVKNSK